MPPDRKARRLRSVIAAPAQRTQHAKRCPKSATRGPVARPVPFRARAVCCCCGGSGGKGSAPRWAEAQRQLLAARSHRPGGAGHELREAMEGGNCASKAAATTGVSSVQRRVADEKLSSCDVGDKRACLLQKAPLRESCGPAQAQRRGQVHAAAHRRVSPGRANEGTSDPRGRAGVSHRQRRRRPPPRTPPAARLLCASPPLGAPAAARLGARPPAVSERLFSPAAAQRLAQRRGACGVHAEAAGARTRRAHRNTRGGAAGGARTAKKSGAPAAPAQQHAQGRGMRCRRCMLPSSFLTCPSV